MHVDFHHANPTALLRSTLPEHLIMKPMPVDGEWSQLWDLIEFYLPDLLVGAATSSCFYPLSGREPLSIILRIYPGLFGPILATLRRLYRATPTASLSLRTWDRGVFLQYISPDVETLSRSDPSPRSCLHVQVPSGSAI